MVSAICSPTEKTGLSEEKGSCKTMAMSRPRTRRISAGERSSRSRPPKLIAAAETSPGGSISRRMLRAVTLLPEPDSPTRARRWPGNTAKLMPSTARSGPAAVWKRVTRSRTSSSGRSGESDTGIDQRARRIGEQIHQQHEEGAGQHTAHEQRDVAAAHGLERGQYDARPAEDRLDDHCSAQEVAEADSDHGQQRAERGLEHVLEQDEA